MPSINSYLGDPTYQSQLAAIRKALADYRSQALVDRNQYGVQYLRNVNELGINKDRAVRDQKEDFASRGLIGSGLFAKSAGDLLGDFTRQRTGLDTARGDYLSNLQRDIGNFTTEQNLAAQRARQEAINRRALRYGGVV